MSFGVRTVGCFERLNQIGEGTYGEVWKGRERGTGTIVALKKLRPQKDADDFSRTTIRELKLLRTLFHENLVTLLEVVASTEEDVRLGCDDKAGSTFLVFEYLPYDLAGLVESGLVFTQDHIRWYTQQLLKGVEFLHANEFVHRDLKSANLLVDDAHNLKIADFGLCRQLDQRRPERTNKVVTLWYRAPELLLGETRYAYAVDMWSVGCVMVEMFRRRPLFSADTETELLDRIFHVLGTPNATVWPGYAKLSQGIQPSKFHEGNLDRTLNQANVPFQAQRLIKSLLCLDPTKRPSAAEALKSPFFSDASAGKRLPPISSEIDATLDHHEFMARQRRRVSKSAPPPEANSGPKPASAPAPSPSPAPAPAAAPAAAPVVEEPAQPPPQPLLLVPFPSATMGHGLLPPTYVDASGRQVYAMPPGFSAHPYGGVLPPTPLVRPFSLFVQPAASKQAERGSHRSGGEERGHREERAHREDRGHRDREERAHREERGHRGGDERSRHRNRRGFEDPPAPPPLPPPPPAAPLPPPMPSQPYPTPASAPPRSALLPAPESSAARSLVPEPSPPPAAQFFAPSPAAPPPPPLLEAPAPRESGRQKEERNGVDDGKGGSSNRRRGDDSDRHRHRHSDRSDGDDYRRESYERRRSRDRDDRRDDDRGGGYRRSGDDRRRYDDEYRYDKGSSRDERPSKHGRGEDSGKRSREGEDRGSSYKHHRHHTRDSRSEDSGDRA